MQGFLSYHFRMAQAVKKFDGSFAFLELIANFRVDCQSTFRILTQELDQPVISFQYMELQCLKLKGASSSLGIPRMALACGDLRQAICNNSKDECVLALNRVKHEFEGMQDKLDLICQLERRVVNLHFQMP
ncbi:hypothetical protein TIFTF001_021851 [Ficus carica]|uniref:Histidine-containing phosphotransfer protein n=1 Tax=Ficus carica TaxID=3494 RepID=A0AA88AZ44_FICCA|nr:hypothetical protein TIFTF001_021851 [Ficus carica]